MKMRFNIMKLQNQMLLVIIINQMTKTLSFRNKSKLF